MIDALRKAMIESEAPIEQYERLGMHKDKKLSVEEVETQRKQRSLHYQDPTNTNLNKMEIAQVLMVLDFLPETIHEPFITLINKRNTETIEQLAQTMMQEMKIPQGHMQMMLSMVKFADKTE